MVSNNKCKRIGEVETYKHLLWECKEAKNIWKLFNEFETSNSQQENRVQEYDNIFKIGNMENINKVKVRVIQEMIQIERPIN
jgi:hypothetical protein